MALKTITINVTQEDIEKGKRNSTMRCPVAIAGRRILGQGFESMRSSGLMWKYGRLMSKIPYPDGVSERITAFDTTGIMRPFEFQIQVSI